MKILLLGGFLGSGKTTVLSRLTKAMLDQGRKLCIVENEIGEYAIDDLLLQQGGIQISTIMGGCVCCQVTGSLISALQQIQEQVDPDWVLVELTGVALLDPLRTTMEAYWPEAGPIVSAVVIDAARWTKLRRAAEKLVTRQVEGSDILILNKIDLNPDTAAILADVQSLSDARYWLSMQATSDPGTALAELLEEVARCD